MHLPRCQSHHQRCSSGDSALTTSHGLTVSKEWTPYGGLSCKLVTDPSPYEINDEGSVLKSPQFMKGNGTITRFQVGLNENLGKVLILFTNLVIPRSFSVHPVFGR